MLYEDKDLPSGSIAKPYIYTNFVSTLDGKIQVLDSWKSYWPIGSKKDHEVLTKLRALADILIHGSKTAKLSPFITVVQNPKLVKSRIALGKNKILPYAVVSNHPDEKLITHLKNYGGGKAYLFTNRESKLPQDTEKIVTVVRIGSKEVNLKELVTYLATTLGAKRILMEGGPTLLGSFLSEDLIDEIFLTITPKIIGNKPRQTLTLVENKLFPASEVKKLKLISVKNIGDELFLRYKVAA